MSPWIKLQDGTPVHILCDRRPVKKCKCGRPSTKLCDFELGPPDHAQGAHGKTCDRPLCDRCAVHIPGKDVDYCLDHADKLGVLLIL